MRVCNLLLVIVAEASCDSRAAKNPIVDAGAIPLRPDVSVVSVQVAHSAATFFLRARFSASAAGQTQRYFEFVGGDWVVRGGGFRTLDGTTNPAPLAEVALSVAFAARATPVRQFAQAGCFVACHDAETQMPNWRATDGAASMRLLPTFGGPLDLWVWRANRTAPTGYADDESITLAGTIGDAGGAAYGDLLLDATGAPPFVFDPANGGAFARPFGVVTQASPPVFSDGSVAGVPLALAYDLARARGYVPAAGDTVPAELLSQPTGSRADVSASASYDGEAWDVRLSRALDTHDPLGDVALAAGATYDLAFALHSDAADGRDHYVSLPIAMGFDTESNALDATAVQTTPDFADTAMFPVTNVTLVLPGVTSYEYLVGATITREGALRQDDSLHGGASEVASGTHACADCHRVRSTDPAPTYRQVGALERLVLQRGGVYGPTPEFEPTP